MSIVYWCFLINEIFFYLNFYFCFLTLLLYLLLFLDCVLFAKNKHKKWMKENVFISVFYFCNFLRLDLIVIKNWNSNGNSYVIEWLFSYVCQYMIWSIDGCSFLLNWIKIFRKYNVKVIWYVGRLHFLESSLSLLLLSFYILQIM